MEFSYTRRIWGYECDIYGHLNNAQYLHLFEEARSEALRETGFSVEDFHKIGVQLIVTRIEIDYRRSAQFHDVVTVRTMLTEISRLRSKWIQRVYNSDGELCSEMHMFGVFLHEGKPTRVPQELVERFKPYL